DGPRPLCGLLAGVAAVAFRIGALGALAGLLRGLSLPRRRQIDAGAPGLGQTDRDRLLARSRAVLALADVVHLLANEFPRLRRRRLAFALVPFGTFERFFLRHTSSFRE